MPMSHRSGRGLVLSLALGASAAVVAAAPTPAMAATAVPAVTGPIPSTAAPGDASHDYVFYATPMDLAKVGYVEQEYFISGVANRYATSSPNAQQPPIGEMPYVTRIVVRRPIRPSDFSGVVVVDWQNVTAGHDIDTEWGASGEYFVRHGWTWVGASVQRVGVNGATTGATAGLGLKQWNPTRYGSLDLTNGGAVTDDSQSYDVYTQIARLAEQGPSSGPDPFAGLDVQHVLAGGVSQSATFLMRYYNGVQATAQAFDGFVVGLGGAAPVANVGTKLMKVYTETDVTGQARQRVPDDATTRTWEIAGGSHVPASAVSTDATDFRATLGAIQAREYGPTPPLDCANPGPSDVEVWAVWDAAYAALDRWVASGVAPAHATPISLTITPTSVTINRAAGFALGGIRLPSMTVPVALNDGVNRPANANNPLNGFCVLFGTHRPFSQAQLDARYRNHGSYVSQVSHAGTDVVRQGFLLPEDRTTIVDSAASSAIGR
jgi:hypothetical protein